MPTSDTLYTARALAYETLERGRDNVIEQPMFDAGALVAPSSGTVTITDAGGVVVVAAAAVTVTGSIATYTVPAAVLSSQPYGDGWSIVWALVLAGTTRTVRRSCSLVVSRLLPPATAGDLFGRLRALDPSHASPITALSLPDFDSYLDTCWLEIEERLRRRGRRPWLVIDGSSLRTLHVVGTLALIFEDLASRNQAAHGERAAYYREQYRVEWAECRFTYADPDSDAGRGGSVELGAQPTLWLQSFGGET